MEKTNKYYSIIENIVRQHRKFAGCEAILDEIINDVYSHAEVIINSINNDDVIKAYLEKVVNTSIITVPKKMGIHSPRAITPSVSLPVKPEKSDVNIDLVDKMINASAPAVEETQKEILEENKETVIEEKEEGDEVDSSLDSLFPQKEDEPELSEQEDDTELDTLIDETPIDNMPEKLEEHEPDEKEEKLVLTTPEVGVEALETIEEEETPLETFDLDTEEVETSEDAQQEELSADSEEILDLDESEALETIPEETPELAENNEAPLELSDSIEEIEPQDEILDAVEPKLEQTLTTDELTVEDDELATLNPEEVSEESALEAFAADEIQQEDNLLELDESQNNDFDLLMDDNNSDLTLDEGEGLLEITKDVTSHQPIDYSKFSFTPSNNNEDIDVEELAKDLKELNTKRPELNILQVYDLKYKENSSVQDIATQLDMSEDSVLEALSEMVAIV